MEEQTDILEGWNDWVDPREYLNEDPTFTVGGSAFNPDSSIRDRLEGRYSPVFETEADLARIRGMARYVATIDAVSCGAIDVLGHYILGPGFGFEVICDDDIIRTALQESIDSCLLANDFLGNLDRELHRRSREDGEAFVWLQWHEGQVQFSVLEPDQVVEPENPRPLEEWLDIDYPGNWTFGIHVDQRAPHIAKNYHVVHDAEGNNFDVVPPSQMVHMRRNVPRNVKRGLSDYYTVLTDLRNGAKLKNNLAIGTAMQAAIAWVEEFPPGTLKADVDALDKRLRSGKTTKQNSDGIRQTTGVHQIQPGTIVRPSPGRTYGAAPLGTERSSSFIEVASFLMRCVASRWQIPEYLISSDASNANLASTLVAEAPFVKARESDQRFYGAHFRDLVWKALRMYHEAGHLDGIAGSWDTIKNTVEIQAIPPEVSTRDPLSLAQRHQLQMQMGILSPKTAATEAGLDYEAEQANGARADEPNDMETGPVMESFEKYP